MTSPPKTVMVVVDTFPQVSQTFVVDHVRGLVNKGWEVRVAARDFDAARYEQLQLPASVTVHPLSAPTRTAPLSRLGSLASVATIGTADLCRSVSFRSSAYFARGLGRLVARFEPDVLHAHFAHNGLLASMVAEGAVPVIITFHGYDVLDLPQREGWRAFRALLAGHDGVVHSSFLEAHVRSHLEMRLHRVTLGVDDQMFRNEDRSEAWPVDVSLLTVGRLVPQKGHAVAIEALARLHSIQLGGRPTLTVIGEGPDLASLRRRAADLGVGDSVTFLGARTPDEVAAMMAACDILLVPSIRLGAWQESFCRVAVEGMAAGMAVIGTATGGLAETIGPGGVVIEPGDPKELACAVAGVLSSSSPRSIAGPARARASSFSLDVMWEEYDTLTASVVG